MRKLSDQNTHDIAIVGMSCRFPGASDYDVYWDNLINNRNLVTEIPRRRWSWEDIYGEPDRSGNKTNIKWGGFIDDIDKFDPLFFNISPTEAKYIDPQHRIFLQAAWHALEDAGYDVERLPSRKVGVYAGVSKNDYAELMRERQEDIVSFVSTGTVFSILANRVSFLLDLQGKSEAVDTACSSFLVALNNAVRDLREGSCDSAIVGGVNAILMPTMYISHSKSGMLSETGRCSTFDKDADGYVRSEGVGVVYIKRLCDAIEDKDNIRGVIKGIAVGHGGKSNFLTAPKVSSQAQVIKDAIKDADVASDSITYVEAHGTGTKLGDPVEISALKAAYAGDDSSTKNQDLADTCAISSVKTNVGHLESAASVAGMIKVLQSFKNEKIPALIHFNELNPFIKLEDSPFFIASDNVDWSSNQESDGSVRRASLSSFGMGGVNAHVILEEPPLSSDSVAESSELSHGVVLSAESTSQLKEYAQNLANHIQSNPDIRLEDVAFTTQVGRKQLSYRLGMVVDSLSDLEDLLAGYVEQGADNDRVMTGKVNTSIQESSNAKASVNSSLRDTIIDWCAGANIAWDSRWSMTSAKRIALPGYPFKSMRCWFEDDKKIDSNGVTFRSNDYFLRDHKVKGTPMVPGVKYLDLFCRAARKKHNMDVQSISNVYWMQPIKVDQPVSASFSFEDKEIVRAIEIRTENGVCARAEVQKSEQSIPARYVDLEKIRQHCNRTLEAEGLYHLFRENGLNYGPTFQVINECQLGPGAILTHLNSSKLLPTSDEDTFLEPGLMDGVFQSVAAMYLNESGPNKTQWLPFYLKALRIYDELPDDCYVYARRHLSDDTDTDNEMIFDMLLVDSSGRVILQFDEFVKRKYETASQVLTNKVSKPTGSSMEKSEESIHYYSASWISRKLGMRKARPERVVCITDDSMWASSIFDDESQLVVINPTQALQKGKSTTLSPNLREPSQVEAAWQDAFRVLDHVDAVIIDGAALSKSGGNYENSAGVHALIQSLIRCKVSQKIDVVYLYDIDAVDQSHTFDTMIGGYARTLSYENPFVSLNLIGIEASNDLMRSDIVRQELSHYSNAPLRETRYVADKRYCRVIKAQNVPSTASTPMIMHRGVYLITGGAGGIGFVMAKYLVEKYSANVILLGRSEVSDGINEKLSQLNSNGELAFYLQCDISDNTSVNTIDKYLNSQALRLNGVLHCAGLIEDAYIIKKDQTSFAKVLDPKVAGIQNLHKLSQKHPLDIAVLFSSIASLMPNQGQCDYASANSFMDAYAEVDKGSSTLSFASRTLAINWPLWKDGGIGVIAEEEQHLWDVFGMRPMSNERGIEVLEKALDVEVADDFSQIVAIEGDRNKIEKHLQVFSSASDLIIADNSSENVSNIDHLRQLVKSAIGYHGAMIDQEFDQANLADLGLNSVAIPRIVSDIKRDLGAEIEASVFFDANTLSKLGRHLSQQFSIDLSKSYAATATHKNTNDFCGLIDIERSQAGGNVFVKGLSSREFFMEDHVVEGLYNVPGACYIEMAVEAAAQLEPDAVAFTLTNNYWAKQLSTRGPEVDVTISLKPNESGYDYEISNIDEDQFNVHALGQVTYAVPEHLSELTHTRTDIDSIRTRCTLSRERDEVYQFIHAEGLHVGPSFMPMQNIWLSRDEALAFHQLPSNILLTHRDYYLHPSLLTGVLQTALINNKYDGMDNTRYIPMGIDEITVFSPMPTSVYIHTIADAINSSNQKISKFDAYVVDEDGVVCVVVRGLTLRNLVAQEDEGAVPSQVRDTSGKANDSSIELEQIVSLLKDVLAEPTGVPADELEADVMFDKYGINSIMIVDLNRRLSDMFGSLSKTLFFEYQNLNELAEYFARNHSDTVRQYLGDTDEISSEQPKPSNTSASEPSKTSVGSGIEDVFISPSSAREKPKRDLESAPIAIVGVSGRYPGAKSIDEFWQNLRDGKDCIAPMPKERFDAHYYAKTFDKPELMQHTSGGFVDGIDLFDPGLFNISPREAAQIDPQERMFLEVVWETIENAGYDHHTLKNSDVGVFVGALWQPYIAIGAEQTARGNLQHPSGLLYSIPNRASFFFDWSGPSIAVDTACSGSLTALHLACESIRSGESSAAIVGGVNVSCSASKYLWLSQNNFLASDNRCRAFGADGDGYVPGEGVGAVLLKPLDQAEADGDRILGVINTSTVNHGGRTNGYSVPNPNKQADLISRAIEKSGIKPEEISYVEAHGTGTSLGDPIEVTGLTKAFSKHTAKTEFCALGSVKSNIGHLEAAAGIAGLTKILLQLDNRTLVPSLHGKPQNKNIDFSTTPFVVQHDTAEWKTPNPDVPRRAMLSSFGAGGSNAHTIISEYIPDDSLTRNVSSEIKYVIPISARSVDSSLSYARKLHQFLQDNPATSIVDIAGTLQYGRQVMGERIALLVTSTDELITLLGDLVDNPNTNDARILRGSKSAAKDLVKLFSVDPGLKQELQRWLSEGDLKRAAHYWVNGMSDRLSDNRQLGDWRRIALPTYVFDHKAFWIPLVEPGLNSEKPPTSSNLPTLLHENTSDLFRQSYLTQVDKKVLTTSAINIAGATKLTAALYIELMCEALVTSLARYRPTKTSDLLVDNVIFSGLEDTSCHPSELSGSRTFETSVVPSSLPDDDNSEKFDLTVEHQDDEQVHLIVEALGSLDANVVSGRKIDISEIVEPNNGEQLYGALSESHVQLDDKAKRIVSFSRNEHRLSATLDKAPNYSDIDTSFIDLGAINCALALCAFDCDMAGSRSAIDKQLVPFKISRIRISPQARNARFITVDKRSHGADVVEYDISLFDDTSDQIMQISGLSFNAETAKPALNPGEHETRIVEESFVSDLSKSSDDVQPSGSPVISLMDPLSLYSESSGHVDGDRSAVSQDALSLEPLVSSIESSIPPTKEAIPQENVAKSSEIPESELTSFLEISLAEALYIDVSEIERDLQFTELGLDSIVGVEWVKKINQSFDTNLNATDVYDYPTLNDFTVYIQNQVGKPSNQHGSVINDESNAPEASDSRSTLAPDSVPEKMPEMNELLSTLRTSLAEALYLDVSEIDDDVAFTEMGLDSIVGVEWMKKVNNTFDLTLNATSVYDYPNLRDFLGFIQAEIRSVSALA